jgi:hypothetical protein
MRIIRGRKLAQNLGSASSGVLVNEKVLALIDINQCSSIVSEQTSDAKNGGIGPRRRLSIPDNSSGLHAASED